MKQIIKDNELDKQLLAEGYIVVPFLNTDEIQQLKKTYYDKHPTVLNGMYATAHVPDLDLRMQMNSTIKQVFTRAINNIFINENALGGSYIAKGKNQAGTLTPHQDWNIVDEEKFRSFNIWVPLVDLHENNGAICIMPKSHLWQQTYRSANIPSVYREVEPELWQQMARLHMKAGEALIYDHRLIHASGENKTDEIRLATVMGVIPNEATMFYYHQKGDKYIEVYESNPEFFLYGNIFEGPKNLKLIGEVEHALPYVNKQQFARFVNGKANGNGVLNWLKNLVGAA